jgi:hypothetical protein
MLLFKGDGEQRQIDASIKAIVREIERRDSDRRFRWTIVMAVIAGVSLALNIVVAVQSNRRSKLEKLQRDVEALKVFLIPHPTPSIPPTEPAASKAKPQ